ncbi:hypothetical protein [Streptomyces sp. H27-D2]|uniref:hypothetical protein n=1 Tax=Streptomyces sp. H27-D2 TaxID=3046304 RepID=UPI002DBD8D47|nr:hypothetical protein [Streptomyces sp. H27-D2]MEC4016974.1 hypothetical protein [Streptomyces sp. H27-D2]
MDFAIDPPNGVSPLQIGMGYEQALNAISMWGTPKTSGPHAHTSTVKLRVDYHSLDIVAHLEDGETLTAIELWRFDGDEPDVRVLLDGIDLFRTPAREVLRQQAERGRRVDESDPENAVIPDVTLAFTRDTGQEVPREPDGLPLYFTSILVANEEYYS